MATAVLGIFRRQMVMLTAFATGVLLICDAWFDWMTSNRADVGWATVTALFFELPLAVLLITEACRCESCLRAGESWRSGTPGTSGYH